MAHLPKSTFDFISKLEKNNNREWFTENKPTYELEREKIIKFAEQLLAEMNKHDNIENENGKKCLHRIYRDIRFSKDKTPYKNHWPISLKRATQKLRGSYYVHLQPAKVFIGCGFWGPSKEDLYRIRQQISHFGNELSSILNDKKFKKEFGTLEGDKLKNGPKDFDKEDPNIELLKYKQFMISRTFTNDEVFAPNFTKEVSNSFKRMRPFLDFMSEALTTNLNGESIL